MGTLAWSFGVLAVPSVVACSMIAPSTTIPAPEGPYVAAAHEAVIVFYRRSAHGPSVRGDDLPIDEGFSYVRVFDGDGRPVADLRPTEHVVVRLAPGGHELFAKSWAGDADARCVGALAATLERGHVYAVRVEAELFPIEESACQALRLLPVGRGELDGFFDELARARSEQRVFLGEERETSLFLDSDALASDVVRAGRQRLAKAPVLLTRDAGVAWGGAPLARVGR